jgi:hypothetical protein
MPRYLFSLMEKQNRQGIQYWVPYLMTKQDISFEISPAPSLKLHIWAPESWAETRWLAAGLHGRPGWHLLSGCSFSLPKPSVNVFLSLILGVYLFIRQLSLLSIFLHLETELINLFMILMAYNSCIGGYIVIFTHVFKIYLSWIYPIHHSPSSPPLLE